MFGFKIWEITSIKLSSWRNLQLEHTQDVGMAASTAY